jgi:hypothetical protein
MNIKETLLNVFICFAFNNYFYYASLSTIHVVSNFFSYAFTIFVRLTYFYYVILYYFWRFSKLLFLIILFYYFDYLWFSYLFSSIALIHFTIPCFVYKLATQKVVLEKSKFKFQASVIFLICVTNTFFDCLHIFFWLLSFQFFKLVHKLLG